MMVLGHFIWFPLTLTGSYRVLKVFRIDFVGRPCKVIGLCRVLYVSYDILIGYDP